MTVKFTISLPDELGDFVRSQENASGYIAEAVRMRQEIDATRAAISAVGIDEVPAEEYGKLAASYEALRARWNNPERRAQLDATLAELMLRRPQR